MTLDNLLHDHAERQPGKTAVLTAEGSITYAELNASVSCLARHFLDRGLRPGDRVAVHWSNSIETVQLLLAALRAGLVAVPVNVRLKPAEIAYIFEHSAAAAPKSSASCRRSRPCPARCPRLIPRNRL